MASFEEKGSQRNENQFNKLVEENLRLENELLFANKCLKSLIKFKSFVDFISIKFKLFLNTNEWQLFEKLLKDVEEVLKSKDKPIERKTTKILPQNVVSSEDVIDYPEEGSDHCSTNKKPAQNEINSSDSIKINENTCHSSDENMKIMEKNSTSIETIDSDNEMTPKALYKSNITYNRRKQSNNCSQNTDKSVNKLNETTEEMTDPTTTQTNKTEIISNNKIQENFVNKLSESKFSTKNQNNERNIGFVNRKSGLKDPKCLGKLRKRPKYVDNQLIGPIVVNIKPSDSSTDPKMSSVFKCPINRCKKWMTIDFIPKHSLKIHNQFVVICGQNKCKKVFTSSAKYVEHTAWHQREDPNFKLVKNEPNNERRDKHEGNHTKECDICGKEFTNKSSLYKHKRFVHILTPSLECDYPGCGRKFKVQGLLNRHSAVHSTVDLKLECNQCNKRFKHQIALKRHQTWFHSGKSLPCNWPGCEFTSKYWFRVEKHQLTHRPERNYVCEWPECGKTYKTKEYLSAHMKTHTRTDPLDKRYSCDWPGCQFRTAYICNMRPHKKNVHQKE